MMNVDKRLRIIDQVINHLTDLQIDTLFEQLCNASVLERWLKLEEIYDQVVDDLDPSHRTTSATRINHIKEVRRQPMLQAPGIGEAKLLSDQFIWLRDTGYRHLSFRLLEPEGHYTLMQVDTMLEPIATYQVTYAEGRFYDRSDIEVTIKDQSDWLVREGWG